MDRGEDLESMREQMIESAMRILNEPAYLNLMALWEQDKEALASDQMYKGPKTLDTETSVWNRSALTCIERYKNYMSEIAKGKF